MDKPRSTLAHSCVLARQCCSKDWRNLVEWKVYVSGRQLAIDNLVDKVERPGRIGFGECAQASPNAHAQASA